MVGKIEGQRRRGRQRLRWLDSMTMNMSLSKVQEMVKDREPWRAAAHGVTKSRTWLSDWTATGWMDEWSWMKNSRTKQQWTLRDSCLCLQARPLTAEDQVSSRSGGLFQRQWFREEPPLIVWGGTSQWLELQINTGNIKLSLRPSEGFPGGSDGKESACNAGDLDLIPGLGRSPGEGNSYPLQYSGLENSTDLGAWQTTEKMPDQWGRERRFGGVDDSASLVKTRFLTFHPRTLWVGQRTLAKFQQTVPTIWWLFSFSLLAACLLLLPSCALFLGSPWGIADQWRQTFFPGS